MENSLDDKLDASDVQFILQLIAHAKGCGISEITYRSCHIRFSPLMTKDAPSGARVSNSKSWGNKLNDK